MQNKALWKNQRSSFENVFSFKIQELLQQQTVLSFSTRHFVVYFRACSLKCFRFIPMLDWSLTLKTSKKGVQSLHFISSERLIYWTLPQHRFERTLPLHLHASSIAYNVYKSNNVYNVHQSQWVLRTEWPDKPLVKPILSTIRDNVMICCSGIPMDNLKMFVTHK